LQGRYQVKFELRLNSATSVNNYEYLDVLDRAWSGSGAARPNGGVLCDIGCASFWYAAALHAFFAPREMVGVEVEGHRLFRDGRTRIDYASGYVADVPNARFLVADYARCELPADIVTAWFPFLTAESILAWRLPLSLLAPHQLFRRIYHNLRPAAHFVMANHGLHEARVGQELCAAAGLVRRFAYAEPGVLSGFRTEPVILSCWGRA